MQKTYGTFGQLNDPGYLGTGAIYQTTFLRMLEAASEQIDRICHRHFSTWEGTQYFDGAGQTFIPNVDILSITSISLDDGGDGTYPDTMATTDYLMYPLGGPFQYPKTYLKLSMNSNYGDFCSATRAGIKIVGVFGYGNGLSATPYALINDTVQDNPLSSSATSLTVTTGALFSPGQTLRLENEQVYVTNVSGTTVTIVRGMNGTTGASHVLGTVIYYYQYPSPIVEETLLLTTGWWKQRENPASSVSGNTLTGTYTVTKDMEKMIASRLDSYIKRKIA